jgi:CheY-like chemotaxis protein
MSPPTSSNKALQSAVLLCIDDNPEVLECEKGFLETFGYKVLTAPSGSKGLELASLHSIDVVIVDYCMPEMNGHEFAVEMRRLRPRAPIIMLSAAMDVPEQALKLVDAFVAKGNLSSQLLSVIAQLHRCEEHPPASYDA